MKDKLKIELYTVGWNEEFQLPFAIEYWKRFISDETDFKVIYYDNMSTDKSLEILSQYDWIEVRQFDSKNEMNEDFQTIIRNNCWKGSDADWVMMVDVDEVFYCNDIISELKKFKKQGAAVIACKWYALCGESVPEHKDGVLLHQQIGRGYMQYINHREGQKYFGKLQLFNPKKVTTMNYSPGMHISFPDAPITVSYNITQIHFNKGFGADYVVNRNKEMWERLNKAQKEMGYCYQYGFSEEKTRKEYEENLKKSVDISNI